MLDSRYRLFLIIPSLPREGLYIPAGLLTLTAYLELCRSTSWKSFLTAFCQPSVIAVVACFHHRMLYLDALICFLLSRNKATKFFHTTNSNIQ